MTLANLLLSIKVKTLLSCVLFLIVTVLFNPILPLIQIIFMRPNEWFRRSL